MLLNNGFYVLNNEAFTNLYIKSKLISFLISCILTIFRWIQCEIKYLVQ